MTGECRFISAPLPARQRCLILHTKWTEEASSAVPSVRSVLPMYFSLLVSMYFSLLLSMYFVFSAHRNAATARPPLPEREATEYGAARFE
jgi:hypothetical protein